MLVEPVVVFVVAAAAVADSVSPGALSSVISAHLVYAVDILQHERCYQPVIHTPPIEFITNTVHITHKQQQLLSEMQKVPSNQ